MLIFPAWMFYLILVVVRAFILTIMAIMFLNIIITDWFIDVRLYFRDYYFDKVIWPVLSLFWPLIEWDWAIKVWIA